MIVNPIYQNGRSDGITADGLVYCYARDITGAATASNSGYLFDVATAMTYETSFICNSIPNEKGRIVGYKYSNDFIYELSAITAINSYELELHIGNMWLSHDNNRNINLRGLVYGERYTVSVILNGTSADVYINGVYKDTFDELDIPTVSRCDTQLFKYSAETSNRQTTGTVFSTRVYDRGLTAGEILGNYNTDEEVYNNS